MLFKRYFCIGFYVDYIAARAIGKRDIADWHNLLKEQFPDNQGICDMISRNDSSSINKSKPDLLLAHWFTENHGNMDGWLEKLHRNVTIEQTDVGQFDCIMLGASRGCTGNVDGTCGNYKPAAFATIRHQATTMMDVLNQLYILMSMDTTVKLGTSTAMVYDFMGEENNRKKKDIAMTASATWLTAALLGIISFIPMAGPAASASAAAAQRVVSEAVAKSLQRAGYLRAAANLKQTTARLKRLEKLNTSFGKRIGIKFEQMRTGRPNGFMQNLLYLVGASLGVANNNLPDGTIDITRVSGTVQNFYGNFFKGFASMIIDIPPLLFGGKTAFTKEGKPWMEPWDFAQSIDEKLQNDTVQWHALVKIFGEDYFWDATGGMEVLTLMMEYAVTVVDLTILGQIFATLRAFVASFSRYDTKEKCDKMVKENGRWINETCFGLMMAPSDPQSRYHYESTIARDDVLKKAQEKYQLDPVDLFTMVVDCNNNKESIDMDADDVNWDTMNTATSCFFPMSYVKGHCISYLDNAKKGSPLDDIGLIDGPGYYSGCDTGCVQDPPSPDWCDREEV